MVSITAGYRTSALISVLKLLSIPILKYIKVINYNNSTNITFFYNILNIFGRIFLRRFRENAVDRSADYICVL